MKDFSNIEESGKRLWITQKIYQKFASLLQSDCDFSLSPLHFTLNTSTVRRRSKMIFVLDSLVQYTSIHIACGHFHPYRFPKSYIFFANHIFRSLGICSSNNGKQFDWAGNVSVKNVLHRTSLLITDKTLKVQILTLLKTYLSEVQTSIIIQFEGENHVGAWICQIKILV